ncbi:Alcohol dehydrogenase, class IV [Dethiosulfatibacter aminovorans DSM 17477]|uniref:Alcohol dehydrogenase, class IV n=1 Tax=Dethiosulfatibacter aminovorans DSM 17477 TaxID=1121476 RepID=A0A1M6C6W3_9FIRM|nr:Alcohol dehydrogenase, class IV [Dethiosulfatibacter aminovorans DSM 17477]
MKRYKLKSPGIVYSGSDSLDNIREILKYGVEKVAVFSDKSIIKAGLVDLVLAKLDDAGIKYEVIDDLPAEPSCDQAQAVVDTFKETEADLIVAVGGGSVMDIAKLASVLSTDDYNVRDLLENPGLAKKQVRTLMIPTTAGTGSEATPNSIVLVPEKELKVGIVSEEMIADYVILDAVTIKNLPRTIAASTGVDALAHAIECYTSKKANPFSDMYALESLALILGNIEKACDDPEAVEAKEAMMVASFYAGVAIAAAGTTAVHALSYPLGGKYHIPHGVSNAMMLVPVMRFNEPMCRSRFAAVYDRVKPGDNKVTEEEKSEWLVNRLGEIVENLEIPTKLSSYGVPKEDLEVLVSSGMEVKRLLDNNMREIKAEDARALYLQLMQ